MNLEGDGSLGNILQRFTAQLPVLQDHVGKTIDPSVP